MSRPKTLSAALQTFETKRPGPVAATMATTAQPPPSRVGKKTIAGHFDPAAARQLKALAVDQDRTVQALLGEALNDLFAKHGKPPIA